MPSDPADPTPLCHADGLGHSLAGHTLLSNLSFTIGPGLTLVLGGEGRGKTSVLRLIAGDLRPASGCITRQAGTVYFADPADEASRQTVAWAWIDAWRSRYPDWNAALADALIEDFGLAPHADKPLFMLSTGSRRKVGLVAAAASGAALTLLDTPYAALDNPSRQRLTRLLDAAAQGDRRAWVVADYTAPEGLSGTHPVARIDLGD